MSTRELDGAVVFRGTTKECFEAFIRRFDKPPEQKLFAQLINVSYHSTLRVWIRNGFNTQGEILLRVRVVLELFGYKCTEWEDLAKEDRTIAYAVGLGVCSATDASEALAYARTKQYLRYILQRTGRTKDKDELAKVYAEIVVSTTQFYIADFWDNVKQSPVLYRAKPVEANNQSVILTSTPDETTLSVVEVENIFVASLQALLPLARYFNSDAVSEEQRRGLRKRVGYDGISELSSLFDSLSNEQSRRKIRAHKSEERIVR